MNAAGRGGRLLPPSASLPLVPPARAGGRTHELLGDTFISCDAAPGAAVVEYRVTHCVRRRCGGESSPRRAPSGRKRSGRGALLFKESPTSKLSIWQECQSRAGEGRRGPKAAAEANEGEEAISIKIGPSALGGQEGARDQRSVGARGGVMERSKATDGRKKKRRGSQK